MITPIAPAPVEDFSFQKSAKDVSENEIVTEGTLICVNGRCSFRRRPKPMSTRKRVLPSVTVTHEDDTVFHEDKTDYVDGNQVVLSHTEESNKRQNPTCLLSIKYLDLDAIEVVADDTEPPPRRLSDDESTISLPSDDSDCSDVLLESPYTNKETRKSVFLLVPPRVNPKRGSTKSSGSLAFTASRRVNGPKRELQKVRCMIVAADC